MSAWPKVARRGGHLPRSQLHHGVVRDPDRQQAGCQDSVARRRPGEQAPAGLRAPPATAPPQLLNEGVNYALKRIIRQPRPVDLVRHHLESFGMPSDHSQFMFFAASYAMLFTLLRWGQPLYGKMFYCVAALSLAVVVSMSRVYLMYHTAEQVAVGAIAGAALGSLWFFFTERALVPAVFPWVASTGPARFFLVRDCTACPDVLRAEYEATGATRKSD